MAELLLSFLGVETVTLPDLGLWPRPPLPEGGGQKPSPIGGVDGLSFPLRGKSPSEARGMGVLCG